MLLFNFAALASAVAAGSRLFLKASGVHRGVVGRRVAEILDPLTLIPLGLRIHPGEHTIAIATSSGWQRVDKGLDAGKEPTGVADELGRLEVQRGLLPEVEETQTLRIVVEVLDPHLLLR
jgi:hypothetical protein